MSVIQYSSDGKINVRVSKSQRKSAKGLPKRVNNSVRKAKYGRYLGRATCFICHIVFRSPKYKAAHVASGHTCRVGSNARRSIK